MSTTLHLREGVVGGAWSRVQGLQAVGDLHCRWWVEEENVASELEIWASA